MNDVVAGVGKALAVALGWLLLAGAALAQQVLYHGGAIVTMEPDQPRVEAVVTDGKNIVFAGGYDQAIASYPQASLRDLAGAVLFPGFIEQHLHPFLGALTLAMPVIAPEAWELPDKTWPAAQGEQQYRAMLADLVAAHQNPEQTFFSWGYHNLFHGELNRAILDGISATQPIAIWQRSCHEFILNSAALKKYQITAAELATLSPTIADQADLDTGHFIENAALGLLYPRMAKDLASPARFAAGLRQMVVMMQRNGVTAFNEPGAFILPALVPLYDSILGSADTPMYATFIPEARTPMLAVGIEGVVAAVQQQANATFAADSRLRFFDKQVKFLLDGAIISQLMQMQDGYLDGHHGQWIQSPQELDQASKLFWEQGYQLHIHVNGDAGLAELIAILQRRQAEYPRTDHRTTIVHFANSTEAQVQQLAELGAIISANPYYVSGFADKYAEVGLGPERAHAMVRLAPAERAGISVSLHSDLPMAPTDPLLLASIAVTRTTHAGHSVRPDLALSVDAALRAITIDAAYSWRMEQQIGSIAKGKVANFTVLAQNPYTTPAAQWPDIPIKATVFEGRWFPLP